MSNRTLIEINHDYASEISGDRAGFVKALMEHLRSIPYNLIPYEIFPGVRVIGARHHAEACDVQWGVYRTTEAASWPPKE